VSLVGYVHVQVRKLVEMKFMSRGINRRGGPFEIFCTGSCMYVAFKFSSKKNSTA